jgi:hypothetical protein
MPRSTAAPNPGRKRADDQETTERRDQGRRPAVDSPPPAEPPVGPVTPPGNTLVLRLASHADAVLLATPRVWGLPMIG